MARILIPLAPGCEELEAVTLIDLLRRAGLEVISAGLDDQPVKASRGVVLIPDCALDQVLEQEFDMIVLPGGLAGADALDQDPRIHQLVQRIAAQGGYTAAICAAPRVLVGLGLLDGRQATGYPGLLEAMGRPQVQLRDSPVVCDGRVITSRGPGTAMDFALTLIEQLLGRAAREQVEGPLMRP
ncbi:DJ-1/PfpI family protein [Magnetovirga frankeli]|uniref:DJ-1 family glyoxalase III n=1 Tax=Magnetovirga frankeli TaxID=947516 RepID=UPI00129354D1|nr:DJ-1/PfpI family protein [gamma proteobacterium SS-5]